MQLTTDGLRVYVEAVQDAFGVDGIDYAQLVKIYHCHAVALYSFWYNFVRIHKDTQSNSRIGCWCY
jgi:hypothetical protein